MAVAAVPTAEKPATLLSGYVADPATRVSAGVLLLTVVPYAIPLFTRGQMEWYGDLFSTIPLLLLVIGLSGSALASAESTGERRFWLRWMVAFWMWLAVRIFLIVVPLSWSDRAMDLVTDLIYVLFYSFLILALETGAEDERTHRSPGISDVGAVAFVIALILYFIVVPGTLSPESYQTWVPSTLLYSVLDVYVVSKLAVRFAGAETQRWKVAYGMLLVTAVLWAVTDTVEAMQYLEVIPLTQAGTAWDLIWYVPFVPLIVGLRAPAVVKGEVSQRPLVKRESVLASSVVWGGSLLVFAFALPLLHLAFYALGWLDPALREPRDWIVLVGLIVFSGLALSYQRLLVTENLRLEANRKLKREQSWFGRMDSLQRLAGGLAHDLDNALAVIDAANQVIETTDGIPERVRPIMRQVGAGTERARKLNEQLKTIGGRPPKDLLEVSLKDHVVALLADVQTILGPDVDVALDLANSPVSVRIDPSHLEQIVANLAINAKQASQGKGRLEISLGTEQIPASDSRLMPDRPPGPYAKLVFKDYGKGISAEVLEHVFEPYFTTRPEGEGTGLGLATVHSIVRKSGGMISVESQVGQGTTFSVFLPVVE